MHFEMNIVWAIVFLVLGLYLLFKSADWLVSGAVSLARHFGISPLIIGLTIVAMGTSAPELAASVASALKGAGNVAIGNVFGSNIANLALIGGICAILRPIKVQLSTLKREIPVMILVVIAIYPMLYNGTLSRADGIIMLSIFACLIGYTISVALHKSERNSAEIDIIDGEINHKAAEGKLTKSSLLVIVGIALMALAARLTVDGGVFIGKHIGLSDAVIGMTIIAIGTSLPELITCIVAALKEHDDISIGNLVGSNVFNTLLVTGFAGISLPFDIEPRLKGSYYFIMLTISILFSALLLHKQQLGKTKGVILLVCYAAYMVYLFACQNTSPAPL